MDPFALRSIRDDVRFYVEALAADAPAVLDLFAQAVASPDFLPGNGARRARRRSLRQIAQVQRRSLCK